MDRSLGFLLAPGYLTQQWAQALPGNIALGPSVLRMVWYFFGAPLRASLHWASMVTALAAELVLLALAVTATIARSSTDDPGGRVFILWIVTAILVSPTSWFYYLVLLAIPMVRLSAAASNDRTSRRALWAGIATYALAWLYFVAVDMRSLELAPYPDTFVWRLGASPVGLLAYLSLYWFAIDGAPVSHESPHEVPWPPTTSRSLY
jgi:hypothetical protein